MKFPVIHVPSLPAAGMALFPFIFVKSLQIKANQQIINHERIHLRQQLELLVIPFYIFYVLNYILNLLYYRSHNKAYQEIVFEREAYGRDKDADYLRSRKFWAWVKFL